MKKADGSVISSYFDLSSEPTGDTVNELGLKFLSGQVEKVYFTDDQANVSKKYVEYDVSIRDAHGGQSVYRNVRQLSSYFGFNNYEETILEPNNAALSGKLDTSNYFLNKNGTIVVLAFLNGSQDQPIIIGSTPHLRVKGAIRAEGIHKKGEFNGIQYEVNKDGEFSLTYVGVKKPNGTSITKDTGPTKIKISKTGAFELTDNVGQSFKVDRANKTIKFSNGTSVLFDGKNDFISLVTAKGTNVQVDGKNDDIIVKTAGSAELHLNAAKVALGASGVELLDKVSAALQALINLTQSMSTETHLANLGYPTGAPINQADYITAKNAFTTLKSAIDSIKGVL